MYYMNATRIALYPAMVFSAQDHSLRHLQPCRQVLPLREIYPGPLFARQFAQEAAGTLSQQEFVKLIQFLKLPKTSLKPSKERIQRMLTEAQRFYSEEVKLSGESRERLVCPGGPEDAGVGLILHIQSKDDAIGSFWDPRSATIRLLEEEGICGAFSFGYDWH
jgi:hypothetical protein